MVSLDRAVVARLKLKKKTFEVLVDPEKAYSIKEGTEISMNDVLAVEEVFEDASKGKRASESDILREFATTDVMEIAKRIIREGEIQLTTEQRRKMVEEKRRLVIDTIARNAINPQTGTPHPPLRIELAMKEAKVHIDPSKSVDELVSRTIKAIRPILPIRIEEREVAVKIPNIYSNRVYELQKRYNVVREEWQPDGSYIAIFRIPAGIKDEFFEFLNKITHGEAETRILR
ncbi:ribosome assembly factor SBDS [Candidatus Alkanophaga liquidiphilum]|nr:Ribosome maturation protein Sdo1 [Candidatus Alkanophaga liquidiphilum]RLG36807.1 MAG: ribosome assembly factor SBDS [Candidatus Alkanophagales archaeon]